jgi:hypothetical protein
VLGRRLRANPEATVELVVCNANVGGEKGRKDLSRDRAEGVKAYLQNIRGIDPARMVVEAHNLPEVPTSGRIPEGQAENRRVEIHSEAAALLDVVRSTSVEAQSDVANVIVKPAIASEHGILNWRITVLGDDQPVFSQAGTGTPDG